MLGGAKPPISCQGRSEGPKSEGGRVESGGRVLGDGQPAPSPCSHAPVTESVWGVLKFPQRGPGGTPAGRKKVFLHQRRQMTSRGTCWGPNSGAMAPCRPPPKSGYIFYRVQYANIRPRSEQHTFFFIFLFIQSHHFNQDDRAVTMCVCQSQQHNPLRRAAQACGRTAQGLIRCRLQTTETSITAGRQWNG